MLSPREQLVEEIGLFWEGYGLARNFGRMHGLLLLSDAPHLSLDEIAEAGRERWLAREAVLA